LLLRDNLDGDFLTGALVGGTSHRRETALTQALLKFVVILDRLAAFYHFLSLNKINDVLNSF
jgi:hypothetical protein